MNKEEIKIGMRVAYKPPYRKTELESIVTKLPWNLVGNEYSCSIDAVKNGGVNIKYLRAL
jgi:hypothetical protein